MKKLVLIGYGNIARKHIDVFRALGASVVASSNRSEPKNLLAKQEMQIPRTYTDYHEMIRNEKPEGILVCVSFWEMYNVLKQIIPYKIPILSEKPTATSFDEHLELAELAKRSGTPVMVGLNRRHYSVFNKAIEHAGGRGKITSVNVEWSEDPNHLINNRKLTDDQIRRYIFGNSIHGLDLMTWLGGELKHPFVITQKLGEPYRWLMNVSGLSEQGIICNFNSSWDNPVPWRVVFSAQGKRYVFAPLEKCMVYQKGLKEPFELMAEENDTKFKAGFLKQGEAFLNLAFQEYSFKSVDNSMNLANKLTEQLGKI